MAESSPIRRSGSTDSLGRCRMRAGRRRSGLTLLEVLAALAIMGIGAAAWTGVVAQSMQTVRGARVREGDVRAAARELEQVSIWTRETFASSVGRRPSGGFDLVVSQITPALFEVAVANT